MSQSRAERRRGSRGAGAPPPKRDPMVPIYIGFAVVIVLVFAGFGISSWWQNNQRQKAWAFATQTPTPGPNPTTKPIHLKNLQNVGKPIDFPQPDIKHQKLADTKAGGQGQPVDQIPCQSQEGVVMHIHSHLSIFDHGVQVQVPPFIGMAPSPGGGCLYWLHTHDGSGVIHVESGSITAPATGGPFTLGNFFDIWGEALNSTQVGPIKGPVTVFVNSQPYSGDPREIPLRAHQRIVLEVGKPVVPPPVYIMPEGD